MKKQSNIPFSILDLAVLTEGNPASQALKNSLALAQKGEQLGFNRFWLAEHHNMENIASSATAVLIGYIANGTKTIRVGSGGIMLPNHPPLIIAEQFGTLATLFPDRIDLGLGRAPGTDQQTVRALRRDVNAALDFPQDVLELQTYFSKDTGNPVKAIPGLGLEVPLWILGSSTDSAYLAAALGLPYSFASHFAPAQLLKAIDIYRKNFKPSKQLKEAYCMPCINVIVAETDAEAEYLSSSTKKMFMGILTNDRKPLQKPEKDFRLPPMFEEPLAQMSAYSIAGSKKTVKEKIENFLKLTQANELMMVTHVYEHQKRVRSYELLQEIQLEIKEFNRNRADN